MSATHHYRKQRKHTTKQCIARRFRDLCQCKVVKGTFGTFSRYHQVLKIVSFVVSICIHYFKYRIAICNSTKIINVIGSTEVEGYG